MNLNQLKLFFLSAKYKSLSRAARELNITQPAVTKGIQKLQDYYEIPLIINPGKNMELTRAGHTLFKISEQLFEFEKLADDCMIDFQNDRRKHIKITASESLSAYYLTEFISKFNLKAPDIRISLKTTSNQQVVQDTLNLKNDIGFISYPEKNKKLKAMEILKDEIVFILNNTHPLAAKQCLAVDDLEGQTIIMHEQGSYFQEMIHGLLDKYSVQVKMPMTFSNNEAIKRAVEGGIGIAPISKKVAAKEGGADLVMTGKQSADTEGMQTQYRMAYGLGMPVVTDVVSLFLKSDLAIVECDMGGGMTSVMELNLPCVIGATKGLNEPRYPKLPDILKAKQKPVQEILLTELVPEPPSDHAVIISLTEIPEKKEAKIIEGTPDESANKFVEMLRQEALI